MMIKLSDDCYVAADEIAEVTVNRGADSITVRMLSGIGHCIHADYGQGIYQTMDRLITEINCARGQPTKVKPIR